MDRLNNIYLDSVSESENGKEKWFKYVFFFGNEHLLHFLIS